MHATFKTSFLGREIDITEDVKNSAISALKEDNEFTGGFTTASHTSKNGVVSQNHFMIKTEDLLSGAQINNIWVYKWDTHTYAQYCDNK